MTTQILVPINGHIAFSVEASMQRGTGHVMRCLSLAEFLKAHGFQITIITSQTSLKTVPVLKQKSFNVISDDDAKPHVDWLVIDNYDLDHVYEEKVYTWAKRILVIDDLIEQVHLCDLLLNQTYGTTGEYYRGKINDEATLLLGSEYALLHPKFFYQSLISPVRDLNDPKTVFICFGGVNPNNITQWIFEVLEEYRDKKLNLIVCASGDKNNIEAIQKSVQAHTQHDIEFFPHANNIHELMFQSDIAIGAGGTMSWERCAMRLPTLAIGVADNQKHVLNALNEKGAIYNLGDFHEVDKDTFLKAFEDFMADTETLKHMSDQAYQICDARGMLRLMPYLVPPIYNSDNKEVRLKYISVDYCDQLLRWQSENSARKYARNPEIPSKDEHRVWFKNTLQDPKKALYIIETEGVPSGMLRFDQIETDVADECFEISILVSQSYQGQGIAKCALSIARSLKPNNAFHAYIKSENKRSIMLFEKCGYKNEGDGWFIQRPSVN